MWEFHSSLHVTILVYLLKYLRHTTNHVDMYYAFPSHFCLNTCLAGDNYAHARTVDTRLFLSPPTKSLGTRLLVHAITLKASGRCGALRCITRQMIIIVGGEPEICGVVLCGMLSEMYELRVCKFCPNAVCTCCGLCRKLWKRICVK